MTRTLWVTNDFPPRPGGIEQFVANLVSGLDASSTAVLTPRASGAHTYDLAQPYRIRRRGSGPLLPVPSLLRSIRELAEEHAAEVVVFGAAWPLGELATHLDYPTFGLSHGHEAGMVRVGLGPLIRRVARGLDGLGVISSFTASTLAPWTDKHTAVVNLPPGVDIEEFHPGVDGAPIRWRHGIAADTPLVCCISRLVRRKGQDVLIEAWPAVRRRIPGAHLLLAGSGSLEPILRKRVEALGMRDAVTFAGAVDWHELPRYHAAADLFAMPCRTRYGGLDVEGLGIVYLEAQACGVPVLAGASGGAPEALADGRTGMVVDGSDVEEVADTIIDLLSDRERLAKMGGEGRRFVEERYAWPVITDQVQRVLDELVTASR